MKLLVVRHGEAEPLRTTDASRALTSRGIADAMALGDLFRSERLQCPLAITSPYLRARQTLEYILQHAGINPAIQIANAITPEDPVRSAYRELEPFASDGCLLMVSHLPLVSRLVASLVDGIESTAGHYPMMTASLAELEVDVFSPGCARLVRLLSPPYA